MTDYFTSLFVRTPSCIDPRDWLAQRMYWPGPLDVSRGLNGQHCTVFQDADVHPPGQKQVIKAAETICVHWWVLLPGRMWLWRPSHRYRKPLRRGRKVLACGWRTGWRKRETPSSPLATPPHMLRRIDVAEWKDIWNVRVKKQHDIVFAKQVGKLRNVCASRRPSEKKLHIRTHWRETERCMRTSQ